MVREEPRLVDLELRVDEAERDRLEFVDLFPNASRSFA